MHEMKTMFEDKFKELKQKNKVMFNQAVKDHFLKMSSQEQESLNKVMGTPTAANSSTTTLKQLNKKVLAQELLLQQKDE
jgi:hypothetical protein